MYKLFMTPSHGSSSAYGHPLWHCYAHRFSFFPIYLDSGHSSFIQSLNQALSLLASPFSFASTQSTSSLNTCVSNLNFKCCHPSPHVFLLCFTIQTSAQPWQKVEHIPRIVARCKICSQEAFL